MTAGHKHRQITVENSRLRKFLTEPRWWTEDVDRVDRSPYPYGVVPSPYGADWDLYYLSILSVLHRWAGLTIIRKEHRT